MSSNASTGGRTVGVLALQGSFNEHVAALGRAGARGVEVRKPQQLEPLDGLIIPGGESTTMARLAQSYGLFPALRDFVQSGRPVWGTCAGLIFLANKAIGVKSGGQELVGGFDCTVHRNFFGSQLESFEAELSAPALAASEGGPPGFRGVFIRAPAILEVGPDVEVLAEFEAEGKVVVAARQGNLLGTAFHPELTADARWHRFFVRMCSEKGNRERVSQSQVAKVGGVGREKVRPPDMPIFE